MANEYSTLTLLKSSLHITDTDRDALLQGALTAASRGIDNSTGRRFWLDATATARVINPRGKVVCDTEGEHLIVDDIGATTGLVVEVGRGSSWTAVTSEVEAEPTDALDQGEPVTSLLRLYSRWQFATGQRVRVTAKWGWPAIPDVVAQAALIQAGRLFKRKDSPEGILGNAEWGVVRLSRIDPDVQALVQDLVLPGFG